MLVLNNRPLILLKLLHKFYLIGTGPYKAGLLVRYPAVELKSKKVKVWFVKITIWYPVITIKDYYFLTINFPRFFKYFHSAEGVERSGKDYAKLD